MKRIATLSIAGIAISLWGAASSAAPITLQYNGFVDGRSANGTIYGNDVLSPPSDYVAAGQFNFEVTGGTYWDSTLQAFCIDTSSRLITGSPAHYSLLEIEDSPEVTSSQLSRISWLYDNHYGSFDSGRQAAAFQLALWEIINDSGTLSLYNGPATGDFYASGFSGAVGDANAWFGDLNEVSSSYYSTQYEFFVLEPGESPNGNQRLLVAREVSVPEPGALGLLGAGLLAAGIARRWRSRK